MQSETDLKRLHWRAHHRGTREADSLIGGYFDAHCGSWGAEEVAWFDALLDEQDVDVMAWAIGTAEAPERFRGPLLEAMQKLDFIPLHR
ncbi:MAG: succinate dehydrogenase assembly factor 2 [Sphingomicrobium sp.]